MKRSRSIYLLVTLVLMSSCAQPALPVSEATTPVEEITTYSVSAEGPVSLEVLVERAEMIVHGRFTAALDRYNNFRDAYDLSIPNSDLIGIGQIYQFEVIRYLAGNGPEKLEVTRSEGFLDVRYRPGTTIADLDQDELEQIRNEQDKFQPIIGQEYILFLKLAVPLSEFPDRQLWQGVGIPSIFLVTPSGCVQPGDVDLIMQYPAQSLAEFEQAIRDPQAGQANAPQAYPAPLRSAPGWCPDTPLEAYP